MLSFTEQQTKFGDFSQNTSTANLARGAYLANQEHRYLLQKYFNNEGSFSISTIGSNTLYLTAAPAINAVSATLAVAWAFPTCTTVVTFSDGETRNVLFTNASTTITWQVPLTGTAFNVTADISSGATTATLSSAWSTTTQSSTTAFTDGETKTVTFTEDSTTITWTGGLTSTVGSVVYTSVMTTEIGVGGVQFYRMPPNYSKLKDVTITVGNLKWTLDEIRTREEWDKLNVFPYYADIPKNFFIYPGGDHGGKIGIWPIPSTTGNTITFNYKLRIPDLSLADDTTGTVSVSNGGTTVTGSGTAWIPTTNAGNESRWIKIAQNKGDNLWYQVASVESTTSLTLYQPYQGIAVSGGLFTLGQMSLIAEDFQDLLIWRPLMFYFSTIKKDKEKYEEFAGFYKEKLAQLNEYSGSNTVQVNLSPHYNNKNPNNYQYKFQG